MICYIIIRPISSQFMKNTQIYRDQNISFNQLDNLFLSHANLIDLRAPIEVARGGISEAINSPLLNNDERHLIGITYKKNGKKAAISLGKSIVSGEAREKRIESWVE